MLKLKLQNLATWCEELTRWDRPWCWERLEAGGEGDDRDWDGWMASHGDGQGSLACYSWWGGKELDMTDGLNNKFPQDRSRQWLIFVVLWLFCLGLFVLVVGRGDSYCLMLVATVYIQPEEIKSVSQCQEYLLCARNSNCFTCSNLFNIQNPGKWDLDKVNISLPHSKEVAESGFKPKTSGLQSPQTQSTTDHITLSI